MAYDASPPARTTYFPGRASALRQAEDSRDFGDVEAAWDKADVEELRAFETERGAV